MIYSRCLYIVMMCAMSYSYRHSNRVTTDSTEYQLWFDENVSCRSRSQPIGKSMVRHTTQSTEHLWNYRLNIWIEIRHTTIRWVYWRESGTTGAATCVHSSRWLCHKLLIVCSHTAFDHNRKEMSVRCIAETSKTKSALRTGVKQLLEPCAQHTIHYRYCALTD